MLLENDVCALQAPNQASHCPPALQGFEAADGHSPHTSRLSSFSSSSKAAPLLIAYVNASVWTGDPAAPHAEAFVVDAASGRFTYVGASDGALAAAAAAAGGQPAVDLEGAHIIPGLIDSHLHLIPGGLSLSRLDLSTPASQQELVEAVAAAAAARVPSGGWLLGGGWDESQWGGQLPSAAWIDQGGLRAASAGHLLSTWCSRRLPGMHATCLTERDAGHHLMPAAPPCLPCLPFLLLRLQ